VSTPLVLIQATVLDGPFAGWTGPLPNPDLPPEVRQLILFALGADAAAEPCPVCHPKEAPMRLGTLQPITGRIRIDVEE
jgi:hypothetical protein